MRVALAKQSLSLSNIIYVSQMVPKAMPLFVGQVVAKM